MSATNGPIKPQLAELDVRPLRKSSNFRVPIDIVQRF